MASDKSIKPAKSRDPSVVAGVNNLLNPESADYLGAAGVEPAHRAFLSSQWRADDVLKTVALLAIGALSLLGCALLTLTAVLASPSALLRILLEAIWPLNAFGALLLLILGLGWFFSRFLRGKH